MKAHLIPALLAALLALPAAAQPLSPEALRRERVDVLARVEAVGGIIPADSGDARLPGLRRRLEAVRDGLLRPDSTPADLGRRKSELAGVERELIAILYQANGRGAGVSQARYARAQDAAITTYTRLRRPAAQQAYDRIQAFHGRLSLLSTSPNRFFDGLGMRPASSLFVANWTQPSRASSLLTTRGAPVTAASFRPAQRLNTAPVPAPAAASGPQGLAALRSRLLARGISAQIIDTAIAEGRRQRVDPVIVLSVIEQESTWDRMAHNRGSGCRGLMQLAPATAEDMGVRGAVANPSLLFNVNTNIRAGVRYLNWIANDFFRLGLDLSDVSRVPRERLNQVLASYNWGIGNVQRVVRRHGAAALERVAPAETRNYISEIPGRIRSWVGSFFQ